MNKELLPIIAAYWGCECSYQGARGGRHITTVNAQRMEGLVFGTTKNFKLHLRPLWSITEEELRGVFSAVVGKDVLSPNITLIYENRGHSKSLRFPTCAGPALIIYDNGYYWYEFNNVALINHLRSLGFCLDQCLMDAELVEWKEVAG